MKFCLKKVPPHYINTANVLAHTAYGDIMYDGAKLVVPAGKYKRYEYVYTSRAWQKIEYSMVNSCYPPEVDFKDLYIVDNIFFNFILTYDKQQDMREVYREMRNRECYSIINRGKLWYDHLTLAQQTELNDWYEQWLDVTETFAAPITPEWVNNKLNKIETEELL